MLKKGSRADREDQTCCWWKPVFETQLMVAGGRSWGFGNQLFAISRRGSLGTQSLWTNIFCNHHLITCAQTVRLGLHRLKQVFQMEEVRQRFIFMACVSKKWEWSEILSHKIGWEMWLGVEFGHGSGSTRSDQLPLYLRQRALQNATGTATPKNIV